MSDRDESSSWAAALVIMIIVSGSTVAARLFGLDPFTLVFDLFIVYVPSAVLVAGFFLQHRKR